MQGNVTVGAFLETMYIIIQYASFYPALLLFNTSLLHDYLCMVLCTQVKNVFVVLL